MPELLHAKLVKEFIESGHRDYLRYRCDLNSLTADFAKLALVVGWLDLKVLIQF